MNKVFISTHMWVSLPNEVRHRIRSEFNIPKSSSTHVENGVVVSDGVTPTDLMNLTIEKMQKYLSNESQDFHKLLDLVVARMNDELYPRKPENMVVASSSEPITVIIEPKKRGKQTKKQV